jgi:hypothetical protein
MEQIWKASPEIHFGRLRSVEAADKALVVSGGHTPCFWRSSASAAGPMRTSAAHTRLRRSTFHYSAEIARPMILDPEFLKIANAALDPFVGSSGTENVACLLYGMVKMLRPKTVVECGSGYTTLYMLAALAENTSDVIEETSLLRIKTKSLMGSDLSNFSRSTAAQWIEDGGKACGADPGFYLNRYNPRLYSIEKLGSGHEYPLRVRKTVDELNLSQFFVYLPGRRPSPDLLPSEAFPIDLAWNDDDEYMHFFDEFWDRLNSKGGLMIFHNTVSVEAFWNIISCIKAKRSEAGDLEILTLPEPHKLNQNSCTILRRMGDYRPSCEARKPDQVFEDLWQFMQANSKK